MLISTKENGKVNPAFTTVSQFNKTIVYVPIDSTRYYLMDATNKYHLYNEPPGSFLNRAGFYIDDDEKKYEVLFLERTTPVKQLISINAEIKKDGKLSGTAQLTSYSYNRINAIERYKIDGEKKYIDYLSENDNNLKISSLKFEDMEVDSVPLTQNITFDLDLNGSDDNYIYFSPNILTGLHKNQFLNQNRFSDIDFEYRRQYAINGSYKLPAGYKVDVLPKSITMTMPDKSINFKRIITEQEGTVVVRYVITFSKSLFFKEDYPEFYDFYKKMHEMLDEQIVLKKS